MQDFNQYYTEKEVSERIFKHISFSTIPKSCIELCAGLGGLIEPVIDKWPRIRISTCDIDAKNHNHLRQSFPSGNHHVVDVASEDFESILPKLSNKHDIAICNPPFAWQANTYYSKQLLNDYFGKNYSTYKRIRSEIIFTIQNLRLLRRNAKLAIILPELLVKGLAFNSYRDFLAKNYTVEKLIEIKPRSFRRTEAQTYALIVQNKKSENREKIAVIEASDFNKTIDLESFILGHRSSTTIDQADYMVFRGKWTGKQCRDSEFPTFHTTTFKHFISDHIRVNEKTSLSLHPNTIETFNLRVARAGDILIARVGTRAIGQLAFIESGACIISDCIIVLRFNSYTNSRAFFNQNKHKIQEAITERHKGTCAKYITISDIKQIVTHECIEQRSSCVDH